MENTEFTRLIRVLTSSHEAQEHHEAIIKLLDPLDLDIEFKKLSHDGGIKKVRDIFLAFSDTREDEILTEFEKKSLEQIGELTEKYFDKKDYNSFAQMIFALALESLLDRYAYEDQEEVSTDHNLDKLYTNIAHDIYLQTFILETLATPDKFDWNRSEEIIEQSLILMTVCFSDIYDYLSSEGEAPMQFD